MAVMDGGFRRHDTKGRVADVGPKAEAVGPGQRPGSAERQRGLRTRRVDYNGHPEHNALRATSGTDLFRVQRGRGRLS